MKPETWIVQVREVVRRFDALLERPEVGLASWHMAIAATYQQLDALMGTPVVREVPDGTD